MILVLTYTQRTGEVQEFIRTMSADQRRAFYNEICAVSYHQNNLFERGTAADPSSMSPLNLLRQLKLRSMSTW